MTERNDPSLPERHHPAHHSPVEYSNRQIVIFLTVCSCQRRKILADERVHTALLDAWRGSRQWHAGRYVIMPDHIHLFCSPAVREAESVAKWTSYWKQRVSRALPDLAPLWQRDCWDTQLRGHERYSEKWAYVRNNPVRAGLVETPEEWRFQGELYSLRW
jgi:putative transposase